MIEMHLSPIPGSRTPERGVEWRCVAGVNLCRFEAVSRQGAPQALARALVAANVPDSPVRIVQDGLPGWAEHQSLHKMALWTYEESPTVPLHRTPYARIAAKLAKLREHA